MIRNDLKKLIDAKGITPYEFWKKTKLNKITAYRLYNESDYIPGKDVMEAIAKAYGWKPAWYIDWIPDDIADVLDNNTIGIL